MTNWSEKDIPDQTGRLAIVTGSNSGLGYEIARGLSVAGAEVVIACRNLDKGRAAAESIARSHPDAAPARVERLDLADLGSIGDFVKRIGEQTDHLDLLVNNAGLMAVDQSQTSDGFETQIGVNHLGHFALTIQLLGLLAVPGARIGSMSSNAHRMGSLDATDLMFARRGYDRWKVYGQSKLANILFANELQERLTAHGHPAISVSAHPGWSSTDLGSEGSGLANKIAPRIVPLLGQGARAGAAPMLRAMTAPDVVGGDYYGPRWSVRGHAVREEPSSAARKAESAAALWAESVRLTGVDWP